MARNRLYTRRRNRKGNIGGNKKMEELGFECIKTTNDKIIYKKITIIVDKINIICYNKYRN